jgi:CHASE2 domain-containing sensor protein/serine phosphatase RsbU (regulator of sigma subunit)
VAILGGALAALLSLVAGEPLRPMLFDEWQRTSPRQIGTGYVAVVTIDPQSIADKGTWPWPRQYLAKLTEEIAAQKPKVIGFDMVFAEGDRLNPHNFLALYPELDARSQTSVTDLPSMDQAFAEVLSRSPVVLARLGTENEGVPPSELLVDPEVEGSPPPGTTRFDKVLASIHELDDVALAHGMFNGPRDADGIVRRVPLTVRVGDRPLPGLALELARIALGAPKVVWTGQTVLIGSRRLPSDDTGSLPLHFGRFPDGPRGAAHSAAAVLDRHVRSDAFRNRIVLIGLAADGISDVVKTPLDNGGYGVFVQAQAVDAILHGGWLSRPGWLKAGEWIVGVLLAFLAGFTVNRRRRSPALLMASAVIALPVISWFAFAGAGVLFDPIRPIMIGLGAAAALWTLAYLRARAEHARLAQQLIEQKVASAMQEGELHAARDIQLGMVPARDRLARLDPRIEASAVLEPARTVGGDFYDAFRIDADRVLFIIGDVTGKGVPAALYMALSKTLAKSVLARETGGLARAVDTLNVELLGEADDSMGVTMIVVLVDCASGELAMVSAGHENPILLKPGQRPSTVPLSGGPPFCVCEFAYPEERLKLDPGDALVLFSDGVTEAQDAEGVLFGVGRTCAALAGSGSEGPDGLVGKLVAAVRAFEHPTEPSDDLAVLVIRYLGIPG